MNKKFAALLKSLLRTCATSATTVLVIFWGWIAVIYFSGLELILGIFGLYALALAPVIVICADSEAAIELTARLSDILSPAPGL